MGQILHGSATTTEAIRRAIQNSEESLRVLSKRYGINQKTVAKWKKRTSLADMPTGPKEPHSTVLLLEEEAVIAAFRKHTLLPLDDCLYVLQPTIPHLTRSSLHRCLQRHGISRLPDVEGDKEPKKKFKSYPIGYFHIDIAEVRTAEGRLYLFVGQHMRGTKPFDQFKTFCANRYAAHGSGSNAKDVPKHFHKTNFNQFVAVSFVVKDIVFIECSVMLDRKGQCRLWFKSKRYLPVRFKQGPF